MEGLRVMMCIRRTDNASLLSFQSRQRWVRAASPQQVAIRGSQLGSDAKSLHSHVLWSSSKSQSNQHSHSRPRAPTYLPTTPFPSRGHDPCILAVSCAFRCSSVYAWPPARSPGSSRMHCSACVEWKHDMNIHKGLPALVCFHSTWDEVYDSEVSNCRFVVRRRDSLLNCTPLCGCRIAPTRCLNGPFVATCKTTNQDIKPTGRWCIQHYRWPSNIRRLHPWCRERMIWRPRRR